MEEEKVIPAPPESAPVQTEDPELSASEMESVVGGGRSTDSRGHNQSGSSHGSSYIDEEDKRNP